MSVHQDGCEWVVGPRHHCTCGLHDAPKRPTPHVCVCGRPDHQVMIRQLGEALGRDLGASPETPEQVWNRLLDEVEELRP